MCAYPRVLLESTSVYSVNNEQRPDVVYIQSNPLFSAPLLCWNVLCDFKRALFAEVHTEVGTRCVAGTSAQEATLPEPLIHPTLSNLNNFHCLDVKSVRTAILLSPIYVRLLTQQM